MRKPGKITKSGIFLSGVTALFLAVIAVKCVTMPTACYNGFKTTVQTGADAASSVERWININTADEELLQQLPGIGPALAARITAYRAEHGAFRSVDELAQVSGIGEKTLEELRPYVTVGD